MKGRSAGMVESGGITLEVTTESAWEMMDRGMPAKTRVGLGAMTPTEVFH